MPRAWDFSLFAWLLICAAYTHRDALIASCKRDRTQHAKGRGLLIVRLSAHVRRLHPQRRTHCIMQKGYKSTYQGLGTSRCSPLCSCALPAPTQTHSLRHAKGIEINMPRAWDLSLFAGLLMCAACTHTDALIASCKRDRNQLAKGLGPLIVRRSAHVRCLQPHRRTHCVMQKG